MIPVNQFILGSSDPLLYPSEKMTIMLNYLKNGLVVI